MKQCGIVVKLEPPDRMVSGSSSATVMLFAWKASVCFSVDFIAHISKNNNLVILHGIVYAQYMYKSYARLKGGLFP